MPEPDEKDQKISELTARLEKLEKPPEVPVREYTSEEKEKISADFGGAPFEQGEAFGKMMTSAVMSVRAEVARGLGQFKKDAVISAMAAKPGFQDVRKYMFGINEFLKDFDPIAHSNEGILQKAYFYAKGKGSGGQLKKVINSRELNRRLIKKGVSHVVPKGKGGGGVKLTDEQRKAADDADMSYEEYAKWMNPDAGME